MIFLKKIRDGLFSKSSELQFSTQLENCSLYIKRKQICYSFQSISKTHIAFLAIALLRLRCFQLPDGYAYP